MEASHTGRKAAEDPPAGGYLCATPCNAVPPKHPRDQNQTRNFALDKRFDLW